MKRAPYNVLELLSGTYWIGTYLANTELIFIVYLSFYQSGGGERPLIRVITCNNIHSWFELNVQLDMISSILELSNCKTQFDVSFFFLSLDYYPNYA